MKISFTHSGLTEFCFFIGFCFLGETNERLKSHTENFRVKRIENAVKDLKIILLQLCKSQAVIKVFNTDMPLLQAN